MIGTYSIITYLLFSMSTLQNEYHAFMNTVVSISLRSFDSKDNFTVLNEFIVSDNFIVNY